MLCRVAQPDGALTPWPGRGEWPALAAVEQFLANLRALQQLFSLPAVCDRELVLRAEMRKTMTQLSSALTEAADEEPIMELSKLYRVAAGKAARLAVNGPCRRPGH